MRKFPQCVTVAEGMSGDIYESMANAVANASVVVLFIIGI
jgi:hypothetical protein